MPCVRRHSASAPAAELSDSRGQTDSSALRDDNAVCACGLCRTDDGTQIMRVLDAVADNDERHLTALLGDAENIVERDVLLCRRLCDNALMVAGRAHAVQLAPVAGDDRNAMPARFCRHITDVCAFGHKHLIHCTACAQRFEDGVASLDQRAVILNRTQELAALAGEVGHICRRTLEVPQVLSCKGMTTLLFSERPALRAVFGGGRRCRPGRGFRRCGAAILQPYGGADDLM